MDFGQDNKELLDALDREDCQLEDLLVIDKIADAFRFGKSEGKLR